MGPGLAWTASRVTDGAQQALSTARPRISHPRRPGTGGGTNPPIMARCRLSATLRACLRALPGRAQRAGDGRLAVPPRPRLRDPYLPQPDRLGAVPAGPADAGGDRRSHRCSADRRRGAGRLGLPGEQALLPLAAYADTVISVGLAVQDRNRAGPRIGWVRAPEPVIARLGPGPLAWCTTSAGTSPVNWPPPLCRHG